MHHYLLWGVSKRGVFYLYVWIKSKVRIDCGTSATRGFTLGSPRTIPSTQKHPTQILDIRAGYSI